MTPDSKSATAADLLDEIEAGLEGLPSFLSGDYNLVVGEGDQVIARIEYPCRPDDGGTDIEREDADRLSYRIAAHIARCSPDNIRALIARVRRAEESRPMSLTQPDLLKAETLSEEFMRLIKEYWSAKPSSSVKEEAWNLIADFAVENWGSVAGALARDKAAEQRCAELERVHREDGAKWKLAIAIADERAAAAEALSRPEASPPLAGERASALPCDVHLPPNTYIRKGCGISTLMLALSIRDKWSDEETRFPAPSVPVAEPTICSTCDGTGEEAASELSRMEQRCAELDGECQQSILDIARERERAEKAEAERDEYQARAITAETRVVELEHRVLELEEDGIALIAERDEARKQRDDFETELANQYANVITAEAESAALRAQLKVKDEALRPFADYADGIGSYFNSRKPLPELEAYRRARAALAEPAPKVEEKSDA